MNQNELAISTEWIKKFDLVVKECSGILSKEGLGSIADSLKVMDGIKQLKEFFRQPAVKVLVEDAKDNDAGFLTDRSPTIIARHNAKVKASGKGYNLRPYNYDEIVTALIPRALEGYRMHGNEINIISFKGMPVIAGKHRRVHEMTDTFQETIGTPAIKDGYAFIKCRAKWTLDGVRHEIGYSEDDPCHLKIPFASWDSIDKVIGLARSKFYKTILIRLGGAYIPDDPVHENVVEGTAEEVKKQTNGTPFKKTAKTQTSTLDEFKDLPNIKRMNALIGNEKYKESINAVLRDKGMSWNDFDKITSMKDDVYACEIVEEIEAKIGA